MLLTDIKEFKRKNNSDIFFDYDVKKFNWFNIGGKSKIFFKPKNLKELKDFLILYSNRAKIFVLGMGSNVLFKDEIYDGVIIKLSKNFSSLSMNKVWCEALRLCQPPQMGLGLGLRLTPSLTGTDGFFCAVVERLY